MTDVDNIKRVGRVVKLKQECADMYIECHKNVWEEVIKATKAAGIRNYSIFYSHGYLFSYYEISSDIEKQIEATLSNPVCAKWESRMAAMQESVDESSENTWTQMKEVFHLD